MIVMIGNKLRRDVIVTLVVMPPPRADALVPEGTLYVLVSEKQETIDADTSRLGADGLKLDERTLAPEGIYRKHGVPATAAIYVAADSDVLDYAELRYVIVDREGMRSCQVTVVPRSAPAARTRDGTLH
jgi:hypothetical protein